MAFYDRFKYNSLTVWLLAMAALVLMACGGGSNAKEDAGTSAVTFHVVWDRPAAFHIASLTDCRDVETVRAAVYTTEGELLGTGGPWDCATGSAVISGIPANYYATIAVEGYGPDGTLLYYGQNAAPIFLAPGNVDAGVIVADSFVPELVSPLDDTIVATDALELSWRRVPGATGYRVTLAIDDSFSAESIVQEIVINDGNLTSTRPDVALLQEIYPYSWRVQANYNLENPGAPSSTWQFSFRAVVVTSVTFVDYGPVVQYPVTTTVTFRYASIDFSQVQSGVTISQWSVAMASSDYFALQDIVIEYDLLAQGNIELVEDVPPCSGWGGMAISMVQGQTDHQFSISAEVCHSDAWPTGVSSLVALKDALVESYQKE